MAFRLLLFNITSYRCFVISCFNQSVKDRLTDAATGQYVNYINSDKNVHKK